MNTTIIAAIIALLGGFAAGNYYSDSPAPQTAPVEHQAQTQLASEHPVAQDFLSMRPSIADLPEESLSEAERAGLLLMREEEKLARDVYQTLYEEWGLPIFKNIAQSEQTHTEAVRNLLEKYEIPDPVTDDTIGVFQNEDMQRLYDDLTARGNISEISALQVGATIEDLDIKDLQDLLIETDNEDVTLVYENLSRGSRNHLRSFVRQLDARDESYTPEYIDQTLYQSIIDSERETGMTNHGSTQNSQSQPGNGRGWGQKASRN
jgi:hypothetical protein